MQFPLLLVVDYYVRQVTQKNGKETSLEQLTLPSVGIKAGTLVYRDNRKVQQPQEKHAEPRIDPE
jgi:hypothetical protein